MARLSSPLSHVAHAEAAEGGVVLAGGQVVQRLLAERRVVIARRTVRQRPGAVVRVARPRVGLLAERRAAVYRRVSTVRHQRIRGRGPHRQERAGLALRPLRTLRADRPQGRIEYRASPVGPGHRQQVSAGQKLRQPRHHPRLGHRQHRQRRHAEAHRRDIAREVEAVDGQRPVLGVDEGLGDERLPLRGGLGIGLQVDDTGEDGRNHGGGEPRTTRILLIGNLHPRRKRSSIGTAAARAVSIRRPAGCRLQSLAARPPCVSGRRSWWSARRSR